MTDRFIRYVVTLTRNPEHPRDEALIREHVAFLRGLEREGRLVDAGPFEDGQGGMIILRAESLEAARRIAAADPFISSGYETCEVRTWLLSREENDHMGMG